MHTQTLPARSSAVILLALLAALTMGCGLISRVIGGATGGAPAAELWADVPKLDGATKTEAAMPLPIKLLVQTMTQGKFDFVVYKTAKTPDDINAFYAKEKMTGLGWAADSTGCNVTSTPAENGKSVSGGICAFTRNDAGKESVLLILLGQVDGSTDTQLFYVRATLPPTPKP